MHKKYFDQSLQMYVKEEIPDPNDMRKAVNNELLEFDYDPGNEIPDETELPESEEELIESLTDEESEEL